MSIFTEWLIQTPGIGRISAYRFRNLLPNEEDFAQKIYTMGEQKLRELAEEAFQDKERAERCLLSLREGRKRNPVLLSSQNRKSGIFFTCVGEPDFPERLLSIPDPPFGLFYKGRLPSGNLRSCAVIGSRMCSAYGASEARIFARRLSKSGVQIISGMARGVDGIAGEEAVQTEGMSFAVLGGGADICYPKENRRLYDALCLQGGVLSEYPPGTQPKAPLFPVRNRLISGLADVLLVIEAREKSGTLITVDRALEQGKSVYALPGRVSDSTSSGCNKLIMQGAQIAVSPEYLLEDLLKMPADEIVRRQAADEEPQAVRGEAAGKKSRSREESAAFLTERWKLSESALLPLDAAICRALDASEPRCIESILAPVRKELGERASYADIMRGITMLIVRGFVKEIRTGYYITR
ncbi:MAG: DNA-processing protein DprA [Lachnospiraceae bacterium]|nr:DNA-processing protein DprA [Lachnospiraceae bacterium]